MKQISLNSLVPTGLLVLGLAISTSCASTYKNSTGLKEVDGLVSRVDSVHVEGELAMVAVRDSVTAMLELVAPQGETTVHEAFEQFEKSIADSVAQHKAFAESIDGMKDSAIPFFDGWSKGLEAFTNQRIRIQSRDRMEETRTSYDRIVLTSGTPLEGYAAFNTSLQDVSLFLSRDFNAASVRMIKGELRSLIQTAGELDEDFAKCMQACTAYSESAGLPARLQIEELTPGKETDKKPVR